MTTAPNVIAFMHIPKTAGTSFVEGLERVGMRVYRDYGDGPTSPRVRDAVYENAPEPLPEARGRLLRELVGEAGSDSSYPLFLCGHFQYRHYPFRELRVPAMTFLRDPVDRVISQYLHVWRAYGERRPLSQWASEERRAINVQRKMLRGTRLDRLAFVGITERYRESLNLFNRQYGFEVPVLRQNASSGRRWRRRLRLGRNADPPSVSPEARELIRSRNSGDIELYRAACELLNAGLSRCQTRSGPPARSPGIEEKAR